VLTTNAALTQCAFQVNTAATLVNVILDTTATEWAQMAAKISMRCYTGAHMCDDTAQCLNVRELTIALVTKDIQEMDTVVF